MTNAVRSIRQPEMQETAGRRAMRVPLSACRFGAWRHLVPNSRVDRVLALGPADSVLTLLTAGVDVLHVAANEAERLTATDYFATYGAPEAPSLVPAGAALPCADGCVDVVVVHDLGRVLSDFSSMPPSPDRLIAEFARVVRPDGSIVIGARSRSLARQFGRRTSSVQLPAIVAALEAYGFSSHAVVHVECDLDDPEIYSLEPPPPGRGVLGRLRSGVRALLGDRSFLVVASRPAPIRRARPMSVASSEGPPRAVHVGSYGTQVVLRPGLVVRAGQDEAAVERCRSNYQALTYLNSRRLPFAVPLPRGSVVHAGRVAFCESALSGHEIDPRRLSARRRQALLDEAAHAAIALERATGHWAVIDAVRFDRLCAGPIDELRPFIGAALAERLLAACRRSFARDTRKRMPLVFAHGDFKATNLLWDRLDQVDAVIDWDMSAPDVLPGGDFATYVGFDLFRRERLPMLDAIARAATEAWRSEVYAHFWHEELHLDDEAYRSAVALALIRRALLNRGFTEEPFGDHCRLYLTQPLARLCAHRG